MEKKYVMSSVQKRLYAINEIAGSNTIYNIPFFLKVEGMLDLNKLESAIKEMIDRHEILRTTFTQTAEHFIQKVHLGNTFELQVEKKEEFMKEDADAFVQPFDLENGPLIRAKVLELSDSEHILMFDFHHIIFDGESMGIFLSELSELYGGNDISESNVQYRKYSAWQNKLNMQKQEEYWLYELDGDLSATELKTDFARPHLRSFKGDNIRISISEKCKEKVKRLSRETNSTEFMTLLSVFMMMLHKYSGSENVVVGTPIADRTNVNLNNMIGMFVNTLVIKGEVKDCNNFKDLLEKVKNKCFKAYENQDYPFEKLVDKLSIPADASRNPIFDVMFVLQNEGTGLKLGDADVKPIQYDQKISKFDLTLFVSEVEDGYLATLEYCTDLFRKETIEYIAKHYVNLLEYVLEHLDAPFDTICMTDTKEEDKIKYEFNNTDVEYPRDKTIVELFEIQVSKTPDKTAVYFEGEKLTYAQLNAKANSLARKLRNEYQVKPDDFVAVMTERSLEMIVGLVAILKAGGAYVPIDPSYPKDRIEFILDECVPNVILTGTETVGFKSNIDKVALSDASNYLEGEDNLELKSQADNLAYMIYTSGTTKNPKGTTVMNRNVVRLVKNTNYIELNEDTKLLQTGSISFDASTLEIWGPLLNGGELFLYNQDVLTDPIRLKQEIIEKEITTIWLTAALYNQLVESDKTMFQTLDFLLVGGEKLSETHIRMLDRGKGKVRVINGYGPTENTTFTTTYEIPENFEMIPIGKPIHNTKVYILNNEELCGIGVPGELCIAGDGVARGYLKRPELTNEKFMKNPFGEGMMYRSGDFARWLPDGNIEFLGRIDEQVKIRGFRIELGEIESQIHKLASIKDTAVIARKDSNGSSYLCAYVVSKETVDVRLVKEELRKNLPDYMIPAFIMQIPAIPVTRNGKLDKRALPEPKYCSSNAYIEARNQIEKIVVDAFETILGIEKVSITDSFFDLGGDSIKAIRVVSKIREQGYNTNVKTILSTKTPENIAKETTKESTPQTAEQGEIFGEVALTPIQKAFMESSLRSPNHFNQSMIYQSSEKLDVSIIKNVLERITEHHDMLRVSYQEQKQVIGKITDKQWYELVEYHCKEEDIDSLANTLQGSIDLANGPVMKVGIFHTDKVDYLLIIIHHLAVDGVSWRILSEDLENGYRRALQGKEILFPNKTTSFQEWSQKLKDASTKYEWKKENEYWKKVCSKITHGNLVKDNDGQVSKQNFVKMNINAQETELLLRKCNHAYQTDINDLLVTAFVRSVNKVTGNDTLSIEMEGHGREDIFTDTNVERTVGWFTTVYPVIFEGINGDMEQDIRDVKETLRRVPNKGIGYGILKNQEACVFDKEGKPDINFNYLGEFDHEQKKENGMFKLSNMLHGLDVAADNQFGASVSVNGAVQNGILTMSFLYDEKDYCKETMENLCETYKKELNKLIEHCHTIENVQYTASDFGETEWNDAEFKAVLEKQVFKGNKIARIYPLTAMQEGMLFEKLSNEESTQYVIQQVMKFKKLSFEHMHAAFDAMVAKHDILHTVIQYKGVNRARQVLLTERTPEFHYAEVSSKEEYVSRKEADVKRGFDLEEDTLIRMTVIKLSEDDFRVIITNHHIIADGWCVSFLYGDLFRYYHLLEDGKQIPRENGGNFEQFVRYIADKDKESGLAYWKVLLGEYEEQATILPMRKPDQTKEECIRRETFLSEEITKKLETVSAKYDVTVNTIVEAAWGILLQKYNQTQDVVFGKVVSGRNVEVEHVEQMVGLFINTIPVRVQVVKNETFASLIVKLQKQAIASSEYDFCSLSEIQSNSVLGSALIGSLMAFENYYIQSGEAYPEFELESVREQTSYDLTVSSNIGTTLNLGIEYDTSKYGANEIDFVLSHFKNLIEQAILAPDTEIAKLQMISEAEKEKVIHEFNQTEAQYPMDKTVMELFEEQVMRTPNGIALEFEGKQLTYAQFHDKVNRLARKLKEQFHIMPGDFVAILTERSLEMMIGIYAIIKSGGAYVPIDVSYPKERMEFILNDCNPKAILVGNGDVEFCTNIEKIDLQDKNIYETSKEMLPSVKTPEDLIYMIYTSGTTGNPKGTMVSEASAVNLLTHIIRARNLNQESVIMQKTSFVFDVSVWELFAPLLCGGKILLLTPGYEKDPEMIMEAIAKYHITELSFVPSMFKVFLNEMKRKQAKLESLAGIQLAGEALSQDLVNAYEGSATLVNYYGPTEATVYATEYVCSNEDEVVLIGKPLNNVQTYILNGDSICGIGVPGELCIAGCGVAKGYQNQSDLTKEKFVKNPFGEGNMYRSGDLVRWMPDGNIEYLGRMDEQVKIRGFRIELSEIEKKICEIEDIDDAVVIAVDHAENGRFLCAYFVSEEEINSYEVKGELRNSLPEYMVPSCIMQIDEVPVTKNGKLDKKALPKPEYVIANEFKAPESSTEKIVARIFCDVLGIRNISINDSFFDLGGHSILCSAIINLVEERLSVKVTFQDIFKQKTVENLSKIIESALEEVVTQQKDSTKISAFSGMEVL